MMDIASENTIQFLSILQRATAKVSALKSDCNKLKFNGVKTYFVITPGSYTVWLYTATLKFDGCLSMGLHIIGADKKEYEIGLEILWCKSYWIIATEAWGESDEHDGNDQIGETFSHKAKTLDECEEKIFLYIENLKENIKLIPRNVKKT